MNLVSATNIFLDEPEKDNIIQLTSKANAISAEILPYKIGNALSAMVMRKKLALLAFEDIKSIPIRPASIDIQQALKLALEYDIYACDAYFLQCAK